MKVCPVCGSEYSDEAAFCPRDRWSLRPVAAESSAELMGIRQLQDSVPE